jgi:hypothetical protein
MVLVVVQGPAALPERVASRRLGFGSTGHKGLLLYNYMIAQAHSDLSRSQELIATFLLCSWQQL